MIRCLFSINPGRSGSHYLHNLLFHAQRVHSQHEPVPTMQGSLLTSWNDGDPRPTRAMLGAKLWPMHHARANGLVYAETANSFVKSWGWELLPLMDQSEVGVIILERDEEKIVASLMARGFSPMKDGGGFAWMVRPYQMMNLTLPPPEPITDESACRWYVNEIRRRSEAFQNRFPKVTYYRVNVDELNTQASVERMFSAFGLQPKRSLASVVGKPTNTLKDCGR